MFAVFKEGIVSFLYDVDGYQISCRKAIFYLIILPFFASVIVGVYLSLDNFNLPDISEILLASLSLFAALVFCVLFIIPDKFVQRMKRLEEKDDDASNNYLIRFSNFTKIAMRQMLLFLFFSILLTLFLIIQKITKDISIFLICIFLFSIIVSLTFITLSNVHTLLKDELKVKNNKSH